MAKAKAFSADIAKVVAVVVTVRMIAEILAAVITNSVAVNIVMRCNENLSCLNMVGIVCTDSLLLAGCCAGSFRYNHPFSVCMAERLN